MTRLNILSNDDFDKLYKIPILADEERQFVFELDETDQIYLNTISDVSVKINYILHLGYFRTSQYFFSFTFQNVREDVWFIINHYFPESKFPMKKISNRQYYANRMAILDKYKMKIYSQSFERKLCTYLKSLLKQYSVPKYLLDSILDYCHQHKILRPSYSTIQDLVSTACNNERRRMNNKMYSLMDASLRSDLDNLLKKDDLFYYFTFIKKDQKDFTTSEIRSSADKHKLLSNIYENAVKIVKKLELSEQNVLHYALLAEQYTVYGLKALKMPNLTKLYLLCYVYYRFLKINDHLASSFVHKVNIYIKDADIYQKDSIYQLQTTDDINRNLAADILSFNTNKSIPDNELRNKSFSIIPKDQFQQFVQKVRRPHLGAEYYRWEYYKQSANTIKHNLRPSFKSLNFHSKSNNLNKAIIFLKNHLESSKSFKSYAFKDIPTQFISTKLKRYVINKIKPNNSSKKIKVIDYDCYEFMVYCYIEKNLSKGVVTIKESLSYKDLDDELINKIYWDKDKENIIFGLKEQFLSTDIAEIISNFELLLNKRYQEVNDRIINGTNDKIKIKYNKKGDLINWKLPYKKIDDGVNNPFYDTMNLSSINQIINFTNTHTGFMKKFTHMMPSYSKNKPEAAFLTACFVAKATGNDIYRMKDISDVKEQDLISTYNNFIRYKTLSSASDVIMNQTSALPIFEQYTLADYGIHASVDGQKLETKYNTIKARYSSKYYGLGKGISAYTLFANCLPLCTKIIGANEHESHYLLDILKSNSSDIKVFAVSGDMHSINKVNFILLYIFGYRFMPRFTQIDKKSSKHLVCFDDPNDKKYKGYTISPNKKVNKALIIKESDNILRIFATLACKENTQSN